MRPVLAVSLSACIFLLYRHLIVSVHDEAFSDYLIGDVAVDCGSNGNSIAGDGREWTGESTSVLVSGEPKSSVAVKNSFLGVNLVPYMTSRISASPFNFTFQVNPGQKFIRFHFYPASYRGFEKSLDIFTVKAGLFVLLHDFSPKLASKRLGVKYVVKEFCLNVEEPGELRIMFSPSKNHMACAFVNGIEIISMPTGIYYTPDGDLGVPIVGQNYSFHSIDNRTALEMVQRLNIGGKLISSVEDHGMFRRWNADASYFLDSHVSQVKYTAPRLVSAAMPLYIAPSKIYMTFWKIETDFQAHKPHSFKWKIPVDLGYKYFVRLHFCNLDPPTPDTEGLNFTILIDNQIADVIRWTGSSGFSVYKDFTVVTRSGKEGSDCHIFIVLESSNSLALELAKGLEIFKISNLEDSLATPAPAHLEKMITPGNLEIQHSVFGTIMTIIIVVVNIAVYMLRMFWEENVQNQQGAHSASVEPSCRCFSLADIKLATQTFDDAFVIGKGGFGKVYKGFLPGIAEAVAIKRLSPFSRQGAREFWAEIETLSKLRHIHLVSLIGYCDEDGEMILVYEYIAGGTLADNLYKYARKGINCAPLSWEQRLRICIGAARGLEYLHTGSEDGIIHRDVKDTNILLGKNFIPKISDFGLSKLEKLTQSKSYVSTHIKGTRGYLDPYYCSTHRLTRTSDVYSFGIVMLVVLSGKPALDYTAEPEGLLACFQECLSRKEFDILVDPNIYASILPESLNEYVISIENCLHHQPKNRPTMSQLVGNLEEVLQQQKKPTISASGDTAAVESEPVQHFESEAIQSSEGEMSQGSMAVSAPMKDFSRIMDVSLSRGKKIRVQKPFWAWPWRTLQSRGDEIPVFLDGVYAEKFVQFSRRELAKAINASIKRNSLWETVYYSELRGEKVAIKTYNASNMQSRTQFLTHLEVLVNVDHRNVVRLIGYSVGDPLILVFEYTDSGNLDLHLHGCGFAEESLSWVSRVQIALDSASALEYIHGHILPSYIHCNIAPSSILIDTSFRAKVTDFGLAKVTDLSEVCPNAVDVYAFGVVLYRLISGKPVTSQNSASIRIMFEEVLSSDSPDKDDLLRKLVDPRLGDDYPFKSVVKMAWLARACTSEDHRHRPNMSSVSAELDTLSPGPPPLSLQDALVFPISRYQHNINYHDWIIADSTNDREVSYSDLIVCGR